MVAQQGKNSMSFGRYEKGVGLIEILMSLVVIAVGMLGLVGLHGKAQLAEMESYQRIQALVLLEDIASRLRANRVWRSCYALDDFNLEYLGTDVAFNGTGCNTAADNDLVAWHQALLGDNEIADGVSSGSIIGARGCILAVDANTFQITVAWQGLSKQSYDLLANDPRLTNDCGSNKYGNESKRRIVSTRVAFVTLD
jgi:type IV pilus assembly protein PilV